MKRFILMDTPKKLIEETALVSRWEVDHDPAQYPAYPMWGKRRAGGNRQFPNYVYTTNFEGILYEVSYFWSWVHENMVHVHVDRWEDEVNETICEDELDKSIARTICNRWLHKFPVMLVENVL